MKKVKRMLAVLLVLVISLGLAGFTGSVTEEISDVTGMYRGEVDVRDLLVDALEEMKDMGADPEAHFKTVIFDIYLELTDEGDYHLFVDLSYGMSQIRESMYSMMKELVEKQAGTTMTDEDLDQILGEGWLDSLMASFKEGFDEGTGGDVSEEGTYTLNGNKITFDGVDTYELKDGGLTVDMGDPFGEITLQQVEESVFIMEDLFLVDPALFGLSYDEIAKNTPLRVTELKEQEWYGTRAEMCDAFFGGIDVSLLFQNAERTAVWYDAEEDEVNEAAVETADLLLERFDDSGDFYWRYTDDYAEEYPETDGVSLTMWAETGEGDEPGCFRQFWYSADYQE